MNPAPSLRTLVKASNTIVLNPVAWTLPSANTPTPAPPVPPSVGGTPNAVQSLT